MRATLLLSLAAVAPLAAQSAPTSKRTVELTGTVLVNGFFNSARVNNSDVPQFAESLPAAGAGGGAIRQTRLGISVTEPEVLGGTFAGEVDADFFGGQQPSTGGRTFPLLRLRRAVGTVAWAHVQLLFGQESPLVAERSPRSLASVGFPDFAGAGNLWLWLPQFRVTAEAGSTLRLAVQAALLAPTSGAGEGPSATQPDSAGRASRCAPRVAGASSTSGCGPRSCSAAAAESTTLTTVISRTCWETPRDASRTSCARGTSNSGLRGRFSSHSSSGG